jgi:hypothetical protein
MTDNLTQVGAIPSLMGGSACMGSSCYKRSAGLHSQRATVEYMGVDHCGIHIAVPESFLNRTVLLCRSSGRVAKEW